jgi:sugar fermentation stimulation protein A
MVRWGMDSGIIPIDGLPLARLRNRPLCARFVTRPNRFTVEVRLRGGAVETAHLPDPGRLTGMLAPGCPVLLDGPHPAPRACRYTMIAARQGEILVSTVPVYANRVFAALWRAGAFPELAGNELAAEVTAGRSRFDFRVGETLVEIKSVTLVDGHTGLFPDAVTERGARHCTELAEAARGGGRAALVFVAQRADIDRIEPAEHIDPRFAAALRAAAGAGVAVLGCAVEITVSGARCARRIPIGGL